MQDIKPRKKKINVEELPQKKSFENFSDTLIKKIVILFLVLILAGIVIFYFIQERKYSRSQIIEVNHSTDEDNIKELEEIDENNIDEFFEETETQVENNKETSITTSKEIDEAIKDKARKSINALKNKDFETIANLMHSEENLIFSPYANINETNQSFSQSEVKSLLKNSTKYTWGKYNGLSTGDIKLSFADYYENFIYDQNFAQAEKVSYNKNISTGKIKNNSQEFFPNSMTVEYHFSGFNPEFEGMDWRSLRLVFIKIEDDWYLKAVTHDEPAI